MRTEDDHWVQRHRWEVGERIRAVRLERELSQMELADAAGMDNKTVSRAENGRYAISLDQLARIARVLGVPSASLLPGERPPGPAGG